MSSTESNIQTQTSASELEGCTQNMSPHLISKAELNDLIRDLKLPEDKAEILRSSLQEHNLLLPDAALSHFYSCDE